MRITLFTFSMTHNSLAGHKSQSRRLQKSNRRRHQNKKSNIGSDRRKSRRKAKKDKRKSRNAKREIHAVKISDAKATTEKQFSHSEANAEGQQPAFTVACQLAHDAARSMVLTAAKFRSAGDLYEVEYYSTPVYLVYQFVYIENSRGVR